MNEKDELEMLRAEKLYWFREARLEHVRAERFAASVRKLNEDLAERDAAIAARDKTLRDEKERFNLITEFCREAGKSGYASPWNIGGITAEALRNEIEKAKARVTSAVPVLDPVGYILDRNDGIVTAGNLFTPEKAKTALSKGANVRRVYVVRGEVARKIGAKK